jgi:membrane protein
MKYKQIKRLIKFKILHQTIKSSKKIILPGFEGLSLYIVSKFFIQGLRNGALNMRASSLAFSFFLALFPSIIFLFTLIPYIPIDNFQDQLFELLKSLLPHAAFEATEETIADIIKNPQGGLLSLGFISALYFSTNGFNAMIEAFNETFHEVQSRSNIMQRLVSLVIVIVTTVMLIISVALVISGEVIIHTIVNADKLIYYLILIGQWTVLLGFCYFFISFNYYMGPKRHKGWKLFSAGSVFATLLTIITSLLFAYYVNNFGNYNKLYGSIGTLIVIMMWIYINSLILLLGFDLNASILKAKQENNKSLKSRKLHIK